MILILPIDSASWTCTLSNWSSCAAAALASHMTVQTLCWSLDHNLISRSLAFQWWPLGLSMLIYFIRANTLFSETRTHSPSPPYFQMMWASNFNSPSHPAAVTRNAFVGHWVAYEDCLSPIMSSYMLCMTKTGKVVCWDIQTETCLAKLNPGWAWSLMWKCRVKFEERNVFHNGQGSYRIMHIFLKFIYFRFAYLSESYDDDRAMQLPLTFSNRPSFKSSPYPACILLSIRIRRNMSLSTPALNSYVIIHSK